MDLPMSGNCCIVIKILFFGYRGGGNVITIVSVDLCFTSYGAK